MGKLGVKMLNVNGFKTLIYHSICADPKTVIDISPENFDKQLTYLEDEGYTIKSLPEVVKHRIVDPKVIVLTFDDGFDDFYENVVPILQRHHNAPATVYPVTKFVLNPEKHFEFNSGKGKKSMSTKQIEELAKLDFINIGSHTHNHKDLVRSSNVNVDFELSESKKIISQLTGQDELDFCYPWANHNPKLLKKVKEYYRSATIGRGGVNTADFNPYTIKRIPIKNQNIDGFAERLRLETILEDRLRDVINRYF